jgi:hypothetical protein
MFRSRLGSRIRCIRGRSLRSARRRAMPTCSATFSSPGTRCGCTRRQPRSLPDFAAENIGFFTAPYEMRAMLGKPVVDRADKAVHITLPSGLTRTAKYLGSQGCMTFPLGESAVHFKPVVVRSQLPDAGTEPWPMGDVLAEGPCCWSETPSVALRF